MTHAKELAEVLKSAANGLTGQHRKISVALTALGSELPVEDLVMAAQLASDEIEPVVIGPKAAEGLRHVFSDELSDAHCKMNDLFQKAEIDAAVTLHYPFPLGVATMTCLVCPATGRQMVLASTTGSSDTVRVAAMVKNAISGIALAKALGVEKPTVGILNIDHAPNVERALNTLSDNGYVFTWASSQRADGGALMRGNDLIQGTPDVMVCDSLTGNLLVKLWSASQSGGNIETVGCGYGVGLGLEQKNPIVIISRASGLPVITEAMRFCRKIVDGNVMQRWQDEWQSASQSGLHDILKASQVVTTSYSSGESVPMPNKTIVSEEIHGIDILEIEDAKTTLWKAGIYAETGMGCTGPVVMVNPAKSEEAKIALKRFLV